MKKPPMWVALLITATVAGLAGFLLSFVVGLWAMLIGVPIGLIGHEIWAGMES